MTSKACPQRYEELLQSSALSAQVGAMPAALSSALSGHARPAPAVSSSASSVQAGAALAASSSGSSGQAGAGRDSDSCIIVDIGGTGREVPAASSSGQAGAAPALRYDDSQVIYQRYVTARDDWYKAQPRGSLKTNQQYRKALGLPLRYDKASYQWCLDWKQMGKRCTTPTGSRDWTKEEMIAYLDWTKAEDDRVEAQIAGEVESNLLSSRRGMREIWEAAAADGEAQQAFYSGR